MPNIFVIDGETFDVGVVELKRGAQVLDKYANRNESGDLLRKIIGVYYNYYLTFPELNLDSEEYERLYNKITEPVEFHNITVPASTGTFSFEAYITAGEDNLFQHKEDGNHIWGGLKVSFIAKSPARRPT